MAILKKTTRCCNCGESMQAGSQVKWQSRHAPIINGQGFRTGERQFWAAAHSTFADCEEARHGPIAERIEQAKADARLLDNQAERYAAEGNDPEMIDFSKECSKKAWLVVASLEKTVQQAN